MSERYPGLATKARKFLLLFPTSYLLLCGFSALANILTKKRNNLDIGMYADERTCV